LNIYQNRYKQQTPSHGLDLDHQGPNHNEVLGLRKERELELDHHSCIVTTRETSYAERRATHKPTMGSTQFGNFAVCLDFSRMVLPIGRLLSEGLKR
jgi:hypothetical protein